MSEKKKNLEKNHQKDNVQEPETAYNTKRITFFDSFEEENEYTCRSYARLTPEERLAAVTTMRLTAHPHLNEESRPWGEKIYYDSK